jgi:hypothetical protein
MAVPAGALAGWIASSLLASASAWAAYPNCPKAPATGSDVETWRQGALAGLDQGQNTVSAVASNIDQCFPQEVPACLKRARAYSLAHDSNLPSTSNTETAADAVMRRPPPGFETPVAPGAPAPNPPTFRLFQGQPGTPGYKDIEQIAKERGWPVVRYKSRHSGGFEKTTASLLMIRVPGDKLSPPKDYDQYINIGLPADPEDYVEGGKIDPIPKGRIPTEEDYKTKSGLPTIWTIVTVQRPKGNRPPRVFFDLFKRQAGSPDYVENYTPSVRSTCYECHPNGIREISPLGYGLRESDVKDGKAMPPEQWKAVQEMNASMEHNTGFKMQDWGTYTRNGRTEKLIDPEGEGPVVGPVKPLTRKIITRPDGTKVIEYPTRTREFIMGENGEAGCATGQTEWDLTDIFGRPPGKTNIYRLTDSPAINWRKVRDAMSCASCHNNRIRGSLNAGTRFSEIAFKILVDRSMPLGRHHNPLQQGDDAKDVVDELNDNERIALASCLYAEFQQEKNKIPDWLTEISCTKNESVADVHASGGAVSAHPEVNHPGPGAGPAAEPGGTAGGAVPH